MEILGPPAAYGRVPRRAACVLVQLAAAEGALTAGITIESRCARGLTTICGSTDITIATSARGADPWCPRRRRAAHLSGDREAVKRARNGARCDAAGGPYRYPRDAPTTSPFGAQLAAQAIPRRSRRSAQGIRHPRRPASALVDSTRRTRPWRSGPFLAIVMAVRA